MMGFLVGVGVGVGVEVEVEVEVEVGIFVIEAVSYVPRFLITYFMLL